MAVGSGDESPGKRGGAEELQQTQGGLREAEVGRHGQDAISR
jgi:hypothetical protein